MDQAELNTYTMKESIGRLTEHMPDIMKHYHAFTNSVFNEGALTAREKQLIALGCSLSSRDEYCIEYHTAGCLEAGIDAGAIREAGAVAAAVHAGAVFAQSATEVEWNLSEN